MSYATTERVQEFYPAGSVEALGENDFRIEFVAHGLTQDGKRYYPKRTCEAAATSRVFEGAKMYFNHASADDLKRGYRDVREWAATIKPGTIECVDGNLRAICHAHTQEALAILNDPVAKVAVGLSHDSFVKLSPQKIDGRAVHVVEAITKCNSVDIVPTGNANGRVLEAAPDTQEVPDMALEDLTVEQLREARPELVQQILAAKPQDAKPEPVDVEKRVAEAIKPLQDKIAALETEKQQADALAAQGRIVESMIAGEAGAGLSLVSRTRITEQLKAALVEPEKLADRVKEAVAAEKEYAASILREAGIVTRVTGAGQSTPGGDAGADYEARFKSRCAEAGVQYVAPDGTAAK